VQCIFDSRARDDMTMGQRAIWAAKALPYVQHGGDRRSAKAQSSLESKHVPMVSKSYLSQARVVLEHAPDLAEQVVKGEENFSRAFEEAKRRKAEADDNTDKLQRFDGAISPRRRRREQQHPHRERGQD